MTTRQRYNAYINSQQWRDKREEFLEPGENECEWCHEEFDRSNIQVHHKHYDTLGNERREDVEIVCVDCHPKADAMRVRNQRHQRRSSLWDRLET